MPSISSETPSPSLVGLVPGWLPSAPAPSGRDRRIHERRMAHELDWLKSTRLRFGPSLSLIDLSEGGALFESTTPLRPGSTAALTINGRGIAETASFRVLRCEVANLDGGLVYRGACVFEQQLALPDSLRATLRGAPAGPSTEPTAAYTSGLPPQLDALLQKIQGATARSNDANLGATVAALLVEVGEALKRGDTPDRILAFVERRLGRKLTQPEVVEDRPRRISITVPEMPSPAARSDKPARKVAAPPYRAQPAPARESVPALTPDLLAGSAWNKLVVRFLDGRLLKGYSQDFHPSRPHFHLCTDIAAKEKPVLVPMPHLKAVFFVRCFDGNPDFVESREFEGKQPGRRIEVTFLDDEVMVGTTLGYRPDGTGFFVSPADREGNNLRVFVLPAAVRHIRYL